MLTDFAIPQSILLTILTMFVIWRASDGFETASEYIGRHLTDGVRGATINAIASSIPELFTTIFFLLLLKDADGFAGGVGTTAGSAIYNGMIIPALVVIVVIWVGIAKSIQVSRRVIIRDGVALILCELVLILVLSSLHLHWWHGLILMLLYFLYVVYMIRAMRKRQSRAGVKPAKEIIRDPDAGLRADEPSASWINSVLKLDLETLIIGRHHINSGNAWLLLVVSTVIIALACAVLVYACESFGEAIGVPIYFVAVIIAAAATSVPDTIISIRDGMRGNYDDAVSNALGSNIFDICFALGLPLFLYTAIYGQIELPVGGEIGELRLILLILTISALVIFIAGRKMTLVKAVLLIALYLVFTIYIIGKGVDSAWAREISGMVQRILKAFDMLF